MGRVSSHVVKMEVHLTTYGRQYKNFLENNLRDPWVGKWFCCDECHCCKDFCNLIMTQTSCVETYPILPKNKCKQAIKEANWCKNASINNEPRRDYWDKMERYFYLELNRNWK